MASPLDHLVLLTYDPAAGMAYLYFIPPAGAPKQAMTQAAMFGTPELYTAHVDYTETGKRIGAEFPANTKQQALARAAEIYGCIG